MLKDAMKGVSAKPRWRRMAEFNLLVHSSFASRAALIRLREKQPYVVSGALRPRRSSRFISVHFRYKKKCNFFYSQSSFLRKLKLLRNL